MESNIKFPDTLYPVRNLSHEQQILAVKYALMCLKMRRRKNPTKKSIAGARVAAAYLLKTMGWHFQAGSRLQSLEDMTPEDVTALVIEADKLLADAELVC